MAMMLLFPPQWHPLWSYPCSQPPLSLPSLMGCLEKNGIEAIQMDLSILSYDILLSRAGIGYWHQKISDEIKRLESKKMLTKAEKGRLKISRNLIEAVNLNYFINRVDKAKKIVKTEDETEIYKRQLALNLLYKAVAFINSNQQLLSLEYNSAENILNIIKNNKDVFYELFKKHFVPKIVHKNPELVGISISRRSQLLHGLTLANLIKEENPEIHIVIGGPVTTDIVKHIQKYQKLFLLFDSMIIGDGESGLVKLAEGVNESKLIDVPNLIYRNRDGIIKENDFIYENLNSLAPPSFDGLPLDLYLSPTVVLPLQTSKGCYWSKCTFCNNSFIKGCDRYREKSISKVINEMKYLIKRYNVRTFSFVDNCIHPRRMEQLANEIIKNKLEVSWNAYARMEKEFTSAIFNKMAVSGCKRLIYGVESGCQRILDLMNKGTDVKTMREILRRSTEAGIANDISIIIGFPTETIDEVKATIRFISDNVGYIDTVYGRPFTLHRDTNIWINRNKYLILSGKGRKYVVKEGISTKKSAHLCKIFPSLFPEEVRNKLKIRVYP